MTSSLVGSEMCIRDRGDINNGTTHREYATETAKPSERTTGTERQRCRTVSYTHLTLPTICSV
eukprot:4798062-Prorocentrum_lima.AAC.1